MNEGHDQDVVKDEFHEAKRKQYESLQKRVKLGGLSANEYRLFEKLHQELFGELDPASNIVETVQEVAEHFKKTDRTIQRWKKRGMPVLESGRYDLDAIAAWRYKSRGRSAPAAQGGNGESSETDWHNVNKEYQARIRELDLKKRMKELVDIKTVRAVFAERDQALARGLAALERLLPPIIIACDSEREIQAVIRRHMLELIEAYSAPLSLDEGITPGE